MSKCDKCKKPCEFKNKLIMIDDEGKEVTLEVIITECEVC
jgi:hypothetical protein